MRFIKRILLVFSVMLAPFLFAAGLRQAAAVPPVPCEHPYDPAGKEYIDRGDYEKGLGYFEDAMEDENEAKKPEVVLTLCRLYWVTGKYTEIIEEVDAAAKRDVKSPRLDLAKAEALYRTGKVEEAGKMFLKIAGENPDLPKAQLDLGKFYYETGQLDKSTEIFTTLAGLDRKQYEHVPETLYCIGEAARMISDYGTADTVLSWAYAADKFYEEPYVSRAQLYIDLFDIGYAYRGVLERGLMENNRRSPMGHVMQGWALFYDFTTRSRFELALAEAESALRYNPNLIEALDLAAYINSFHERFDKAQEYIDRALAVNPNSLSALAQQGFLYYFSGQMDKYAETEKKVLEINPKCAEFYFLIGNTMGNRYGFKYAVEFCEKAIAVNPNFELAYPVLARNLLFIGNEERGLLMLERAWQTAGAYDPRVKNLRLVMDFVTDKSKMVERRSEHFIIRLPVDEAPVLGPYIENLLEDAWRKLSVKYGYEPEEKPIRIEFFSNPKYFSGRTVGLPGLGFAGGASFGTFITGRTPNGFRGNKGIMGSWGEVAYHEFTHVVTIQRAKSRVSRWLTEALSELEQQTLVPAWGREEYNDRRFVMAMRGSGLIPIADLDMAFLDQRVHVAYYQGYLTGVYLRGKYGYEKIQEMLDEYAKRRTTAQVIETCLGVSCKQFDKDFDAWCRERFKDYALGALYNKDDLEDLLRQLDKRENWRNAELHAEIARAYAQNNNKKKYDEFAEKTLKLDPDNGDIYLIKAMTLISGREKKFDEALPLLLKAEEMKAKDAFNVYFALGKCYKNQKDMANAEKYFLLARKAFPTLVGADSPFIELQTIYNHQGRKDEVLKLKEEYKDLMPLNLQVREELLIVYESKGENEKLAQTCLEILYVDPDYRGIYFNFDRPKIANIFKKVGWWDKAGTQYEVAAYGSASKDEMYTEAAKCYLEAGWHAKAKSLIILAIQANKDYKEAYDVKKKIEEHTGAFEVPEPEPEPKPEAKPETTPGDAPKIEKAPKPEEDAEN